MGQKKFTRDDLVELVTKIIEVKGTEEEIDKWIEIFEENVPHPEASDLIFWNENDDVTSEEIVDQALTYKPIQL